MNGPQPGLAVVTCIRCECSHPFPAPRSWESYPIGRHSRSQGVCGDCMLRVINRALASMRRYADTPQGRAEFDAGAAA